MRKKCLSTWCNCIASPSWDATIRGGKSPHILHSSYYTNTDTCVKKDTDKSRVLEHVPIYLNCFREGCKAFLLLRFKNSKISPDFPDNDWIFIFGWTYPLVCNSTSSFICLFQFHLSIWICRLSVNVYLPLDLSWSERWNGKWKKVHNKIKCT